MISTLQGGAAVLRWAEACRKPSATGLERDHCGPELSLVPVRESVIAGHVFQLGGSSPGDVENDPLVGYVAQLSGQFLTSVGDISSSSWSSSAFRKRSDPLGCSGEGTVIATGGR